MKLTQLSVIKRHKLPSSNLESRLRFPLDEKGEQIMFDIAATGIATVEDANLADKLIFTRFDVAVDRLSLEAPERPISVKACCDQTFLRRLDAGYARHFAKIADRYVIERAVNRCGRATRATLEMDRDIRRKKKHGSLEADGDAQDIGGFEGSREPSGAII